MRPVGPVVRRQHAGRQHEGVGVRPTLGSAGTTFVQGVPEADRGHVRTPWPQSWRSASRRWRSWAAVPPERHPRCLCRRRWRWPAHPRRPRHSVRRACRRRQFRRRSQSRRRFRQHTARARPLPRRLPPRQQRRGGTAAGARSASSTLGASRPSLHPTTGMSSWATGRTAPLVDRGSLGSTRRGLMGGGRARAETAFCLGYSEGPVPIAQVTAAASSGISMILLGTELTDATCLDPRAPGEERAVSWASSDGRNWRRSVRSRAMGRTRSMPGQSQAAGKAHSMSGCGASTAARNSPRRSGDRTTDRPGVPRRLWSRART